jgi:hypothetical protein
VTAPTLEAVLAAFRPGRVVGLDLTREQKRELRDADGQIALDVLRHLLGARAAVGAPERFPSPRGPSRRSSAARAQGRAEALPWAAPAARGGGSRPSIGQLPPALQGLRSPLGLLPAPVQNPAEDPTVASILSASPLPSSANEGVDGGSTPSSGTTRGSHRRGLRARGRGRWSLWTRYSDAWLAAGRGTIPPMLGVPVRVHDMSGDDLGVAHLPTPVPVGDLGLIVLLLPRRRPPAIPSPSARQLAHLGCVRVADREVVARRHLWHRQVGEVGTSDGGRHRCTRSSLKSRIGLYVACE